MVRMDYSLCWLHLALGPSPPSPVEVRGSELHAPWSLGVVHSSGSSSARPCVPKRPFGTGTLAAAPGSHRAAPAWTGSAVGLGAPPALGPGVTAAPPPPPPAPVPSSLRSVIPLGGFHTHPFAVPGAPSSLAVFLRSPNHASCWPELPQAPTGQPAHGEFW